jgi:hypothetical protein
MYDAACMPDPVTNTYCYVDAAAEPTPGDLYIYQLPLGISLPEETTNLTCSSCSKSVLALYANALTNKTVENGLTGLKGTYESSAQIANNICGADYAKIGIVNGALGLTGGLGSAIVVTVVLVWTLVL